MEELKNLMFDILNYKKRKDLLLLCSNFSHSFSRNNVCFVVKKILRLTRKRNPRFDKMTGILWRNVKKKTTNI